MNKTKNNYPSIPFPVIPAEAGMKRAHSGKILLNIHTCRSRGIVAKGGIKPPPAGGRSNSRRGFTMIEIMIAVVILGIVLSAVYGAYTGTLRLVDDIDYSDEVYGMARGAVEQIMRDLESACRFNGVFTFISKEQELGEEAVMSLRFVSSRHLDFEGGAGGVAEIAYYGVKEQEDKGYRILRKDVLLQKQDEEAEEDELFPEEGYRLCENVQAFRWTFFDVKGEEYEAWDSESDSAGQKGRIPAVARVRIDFVNPADEENPYRFVTNIYIPASESLK